MQLRVHVLRYLFRQHERSLSKLRWGVDATPATKSARRLNILYGAAGTPQLGFGPGFEFAVPLSDSVQ
jgi:hypothetical protein